MLAVAFDNLLVSKSECVSLGTCWCRLGIPDTEYSATVKMPSSEFQRIAKDLGTIGDTVLMSVTKDGIKFSTSGDIGSANVTVR